MSKGTNLSKIFSKFSVFLALLSTVHSDAVGTLIFAGCDKNGWKCISSKVKTDKYDLEFDCNGTSSTSISLWNFRAPKEIFGLKISNCGYLEVDLSCGNDGQPIDSLYIYNIEHLNLTSPVHSELSFLPNKLVLDTIGRIEKIPTNLFKQNMDFPLQLFKCSTQGSPINTLFFTDIGHIDLIEHHAINLTDMSWFTWNNVSINEIESMAMQVFMEKDKQFTIKQSQISKIGYQGIVLRAHSIFFNQTDIHEIEKYGISATVYWFDFTNSKIGTVQAKAFHLLAQNVNIMNNSFSQLEPRAFNGIGPGLLENALVSFGRLRFTYVFSRNRILQANVGSLNPDWEAYKNVKTFLNFTLNHLPCSCSELGWVNLDDGLGSGLLDTVSFSTRIMEKKSQNMCVDAPCLLPLGVMSIMHFVNGSCQKASGLKEVCNKFINNKDFRMNILTESDKYAIRNRAHGGMDLHSANLDDTLISDHPFPIVPVKSNIIEKKTEYLNYHENDVNPKNFNEILKGPKLLIKRSIMKTVPEENSRTFQEGIPKPFHSKRSIMETVPEENSMTFHKISIMDTIPEEVPESFHNVPNTFHKRSIMETIPEEVPKRYNKRFIMETAPEENPNNGNFQKKAFQKISKRKNHWKRNLPRRFRDLKKNSISNGSSVENSEEISASKVPKLTVPKSPKPKIEKLGAYKVDWQLLKVAKNNPQKNQESGIVYIPKIIQEPTGVVEYYLVSEPSKTLPENSEKENSPVPITIRPFKSDSGSGSSNGENGKASIHEQISSIAEKLTKDIEQQVQERQLLEQEEELESSNASEELKLQELYDSKEYDPEVYEKELEESKTQKPFHVPQKPIGNFQEPNGNLRESSGRFQESSGNYVEPFRTFQGSSRNFQESSGTSGNFPEPPGSSIQKKLEKVSFIKKKFLDKNAIPELVQSHKMDRNDIPKEAPDWDPIKESEESNDSSIYKELVQTKQKLETKYFNQTFPIKLVRKTRI